MLELGRYLVRRLVERGGEGTGTGAVDGAIFALLSLVIAFTFSGAASRFDSRRELVAQEANAIGTAWVRIDLLQEGARPAVRDLFRGYLDTRLAGYRKISSGEFPTCRDRAVRAAPARNLEGLRRRLPRRRLDNALHAAAPRPERHDRHHDDAGDGGADSPSSRRLPHARRPGVCLFEARGVFHGAGKTTNRVHRFAFAHVIAATVYVIVDLEYPRLGFIRIDSADSVLSDLRQTME